ncbi:MAG: radical SAM protein [Acidobacteriota bacterium]
MFGIKATPRDPQAGEALQPVFQLHPTRRCNLRCLHCYSDSSPEQRDSLTIAQLTDALTDAREQGYLTASFSGGEPLLFQGLGTLLQHAKSLGMRTTVTSNGMLLNEARLSEIAKYTDVLAISLDGVPESHDRMRNYSGAFDRMAENLPAVRASGVPFGFLFTLTQHNVDEAEWAAEFAVKQGATLFQIHPLEEVGRATETLRGLRPDATESAFAFLEAGRIRKAWGKKLFVQLDVFHRELVARHPERFHAGEIPRILPVNLAACVTPLVLEADGTMVPVGYGFSRDYAIGNIRERRLRDAGPAWIAHGYPAFRELCKQVYEEACRPSDLPFFNWHEMLQARAAERQLVNIG